MAAVPLHLAPSIALPAGPPIRRDPPCGASQLCHGWPVVLVANHRAGTWTHKDAATRKTRLPGPGTARHSPPRGSTVLVTYPPLPLLCIETALVGHLPPFRPAVGRPGNDDR